MYIVLLGAPGAGKGTQARRLAEALDIAHIASGDLFREHLNNHTALGLLAKEYMDRGELVPDELTIRMVMERLERPDAIAGAVLDGFPRTVAQAQALDAALAAKGQRVSTALYLRVSEEALIARLTGRWICRSCQATYHVSFNPPRQPGVCDTCGGPLYQRDDDTAETVQNRLRVYLEQTLPLMDYYRARGVLVEVNGEQEVEKVFAELLTAVRQIA
ncbi:MAG: adenylate kinase [Anaerolineae bacterium]|nr:adenylate kinase [Anaerolineae bacterium]MDW8100095.1 adenylate kinase [Anaerolineae bacterium]